MRNSCCPSWSKAAGGTERYPRIGVIAVRKKIDYRVDRGRIKFKPGAGP